MYDCRLIRDPRKEVKIKEAAQMNHIVSVVTEQIHEMNSVQTKQLDDLSDTEGCKDKNAVLKNQLLQLVAVMQHGGKFRGFNRKIQIRTLKWNPRGKEDTAEAA